MVAVGEAHAGNAGREVAPVAQGKHVRADQPDAGVPQAQTVERSLDGADEVVRTPDLVGHDLAGLDLRHGDAQHGPASGHYQRRVSAAREQAGLVRQVRVLLVVTGQIPDRGVTVVGRSAARHDHGTIEAFGLQGSRETVLAPLVLIAADGGGVRHRWATLPDTLE